jgi:hypothetical protein
MREKYMSQHRDLLEKKIGEQVVEEGATLVRLRNGDPHENGWRKGYLMALEDVLNWSLDIAKELNQ